MSAPLRFLAVAVVGWVGLRSMSLGMVPGAEAFTLSRFATPIEKSIAGNGVPAIAATEFPPLEPPLAQLAAGSGGTSAAELMMPAVMPTAMPAEMPGPMAAYYYPAMLPRAAPSYGAELPARRSRPGPMTAILPVAEPQFWSPIPQLDEWPLSRMASAAFPARRSATTIAQQSAAPGIIKPRLDRLQLTAWALIRGQQGLITAPNSLATGGTLGGSQAGARLTYQVTPAFAATLRSSSPVGARGGEVAAGVRWRPLRSIPIAVTAERRQAIGATGGGRSAFALFLEGGVYQRPMPLGFSLDAYGQGGVVGARSRDLFFDGGATFTRPVYRQFSAGFGVWGGTQPGVYRVDAGPRVSMKVRNNLRVHFDYRQRLAGNAEPGSGPTVTLAGDF